MAMQIHGLVQDIFALSFHFQDAQAGSHGHNRFEYILTMMAFFTNFFLRPLYALIGWYYFMDRRGDVTQSLLRRSGGSQLDSRVSGGHQQEQQPHQAPPPQVVSGGDANPFDNTQ